MPEDIPAVEERCGFKIAEGVMYCLSGLATCLWHEDQFSHRAIEVQCQA